MKLTNKPLYFMKKLFAVLALATAGTQADAALFINNSSGCDAAVQIFAHDGSLTSPCSYYLWVEVAASGSRAYNNITSVSPEWTPTTAPPYTYVPVTAAGSAFDAAGINGFSPVIGNPGTCALGTTVSYTGSTTGCNFTATWTNLGGGNIFIDIQ